MAGLARNLSRAVLIWALTALTGVTGVTATAQIPEPPFLAAAVARGELPPVAQRLPRNPSVAATWPGADMTTGRYGGTLRMLISKARDVRLFGVYGYARLVRYDRRYRLVPDLAEAVEVEDGRVFTFRLRPGHKWSDGEPFTSEDFRYYWEDVANNPALSPAGPPRLLFVGDEPPEVTFPDALTVRFAWSRPNPIFLHVLARARPVFIYRPAHYLRRFHERYARPEEVAAAAKKAGVRNWAELHNRLDNMYKFDNIELPTLQPWVNTTPPPATRFTGQRNPYFHRVDETGRQLPYIDRVQFMLTDTNLIAAKAAAGDVDLQLRGISFSDIAFLKQGEARQGFHTRLWRSAAGAAFALFPNLNVEDPVWRKLIRDARFRHALSLGIDREIINQSLFFGLAVPGNNTVQQASPLYREHYKTAWAGYDPDQANRLLDELGLTERNGAGIRLLSDGRAAEIIVETAGEDPSQADVLELIEETWREIGIKIYTRALQRTVLRNRIYAGQTVMAVWGGLENGVPTANMSPAQLAPTVQDAFMWPKWGQYYETRGRSGEAPDLAPAAELVTLYQAWLAAGTEATREGIWHRMLEIHAEQQYSIGVLSGVLQPVVVAGNLRNVPEDGVLAWDPGAQIGIYETDRFWFEAPGEDATATE